MLMRLVAAVAIAIGLNYAFRASDDLGAAAAVVALGLGVLLIWIDRRLLPRRRSEPS
jgi:membrane associated rhomboid family serine protease